MSIHYAVLYINIDEPECSEVYGIYKELDMAVDKLILAANYREKDDKLTQYMEYTEDYPSMNVLREYVKETRELKDVDIYRIEALFIN